MQQNNSRSPHKSSYLLAVAIVITISMATLVQADLGGTKQNTCFNIRVLANCSTISLIEVTNANQTFLINQTMDFLGGQTFSYSFCNTSLISTYSYSWNNPCVDCSQGNCGNSFSVTATGQDFTVAKSITYILIFFISLLLFIGLLIAGIFLPVSNNKDEMTGYIIAVNNLKYLKIVCLGIAYIDLIFMSFFSWQVCYAYLDLIFLATISQFLFYGLAILSLPLFILTVYILIANAVRDSQVAEMLSRGLHVK